MESEMQILRDPERNKMIRADFENGMAILHIADKYRLSKMIKGASAVLTPTTPSAYERFLDASVVLTENLVPADGRIAFVSPGYYRDFGLSTQI